MIRIYFFSFSITCQGLSDLPWVSSFSCRRFVGLMMDSQYLDETAILRFRHPLGKSCYDKKIFLLFK